MILGWVKILTYNDNVLFHCAFSFKDVDLFLIMFIGRLSLCTWVQMVAETRRDPESRVYRSCWAAWCQFWEPNSGPLQEQCILLSGDPFLQPPTASTASQQHPCEVGLIVGQTGYCSEMLYWTKGEVFLLPHIVLGGVNCFGPCEGNRRVKEFNKHRMCDWTYTLTLLPSPWQEYAPTSLPPQKGYGVDTWPTWKSHDWVQPNWEEPKSTDTPFRT